MAGATQRLGRGRGRGRGRVIKSPELSDDGTVADSPLPDIPPGEETIEQPNNIQPDPMQQDGDAHDEVAPLGTNVIEALQIVGRLEQLGLDRQEISLPKCIVLGQQSTGKSSVIEAISGIKTPRDTGTCTRCPLFIELQPSSDPRAVWHAKVSLKRLYDVDIQPRREGDDVEFQGWIPAVAQKPVLFAETNDPAELERLIRCAQRATLSPLENPKSFLDPAFDDRDIHKALFSPNVVCISVSKPGLPPLSFYDLPGVISFAGIAEEEFTVTLVRRLVTKYILDPEALVLLTCPLETDVHNSVAAGLASTANVKNRCLGVLTKPDRLPVGESSQHLANILEGRHFAMGHGYFVVKNLNSDQIRQGLTHLDARRLEREFFSTVAPWSTDLQGYQSRFGTVPLQRYLSEQLGNQVLSKLPNIRRQIEEHLTKVEAELSRIPDIPLHIATRTVDDVVHAFAESVRKEIVGEHGSMTWNNIWSSLQNSMWDMLLQLKPTLMTTAKLDEGLFTAMLSGRSVQDSIVIDSDDDDDSVGDIPETPSKKRKHGVQPKHETPGPASIPSPFRTSRKPTRRAAQKQSSTTPAAQSDAFVALKKTYNLDDVTLYVSQASKSRVPGQIDPKVREEMMLAAIEHWPHVVRKFFEEFEQRLKQHMAVLFEQHFSGWRGSELYTASHTAFQSLLDTNLYQQRTTMASESFNDEREGPHIFHRDVFNMEKRATMERYIQARTTARLNLFVKEHVEHNGREIEKDKVRKDDKKMSVIKEEPYAHELDLVADITTYYMIAARRFHNSIMMRIESKFFKKLRRKLRDQLQDELGIHDEVEGPRNAQRLLAESPERLERRNIFVAKRKALLEGLQCLSEHFTKFQAQNAVPAPAPAPAPAPETGSNSMSSSNYQRPAVSTPSTDDMEDVQTSALPHRSTSH